MKFIYLLLCHSSMISACCWQKQKKLVHYPAMTEMAQPVKVTITNINELVMALNSLQNANLAASISITPPPGEPHTVTPELNRRERIDVPSENQMITLSRLKKSHALIEGFYTYPPAPSDEKINK